MTAFLLISMLFVAYMLLPSCAPLDGDCMNESVSPPVIARHNDTSVSRATACTITVSAHDGSTNGAIQCYYWDSGADGWDDSTTAPSYTFRKSDGGRLVIIWGAKSSGGAVGTDTFTILFNRPPVFAAIRLPSPPNAAWKNYDYVRMKGDLRIDLQGEDPDGDTDTLRYSLWVSADSLSWDEVYSGPDATCFAPSLVSAKTYYWKLRVKDLYGDSVLMSRPVMAPPPPCMVLIHAKNKTFEMGSAIGAPDERPVHAVTFSNDFYMDSTEVTQKQFRGMMSAIYSPPYTVPPWSPAMGLGDDYPAYMVDWHAAVLYCNARTKAAGRTDTVYSYSSIWTITGYYLRLRDLAVDLTKKGYRLPTEAEWEYACRAGTASEFFWGDNDIDNYAWSVSNSKGTAHPVARLLPNAFGLYDMCGNLYEWCHDNYADTYYSISPVWDPLGPNPQGPQGTEFRHYRVVRGGGWKRDSTKLRSAARLYFVDGDAEGYLPHYTWDPLGFRVVLPAPN